MSTPPQRLDRRVKLVPRSPRRNARNPVSTGAELETEGEISDNKISGARQLTGDGNTLKSDPVFDGGNNGTAADGSSQQCGMEQRVEDALPVSQLPEDFARSKSETVLRDSEAPHAQIGSPPSDRTGPVTPSSSVDSVDIPLPSVEPGDGFAEDPPLIAVTNTADSDSDRNSIPESTEPATPLNGDRNSTPQLANGIADLSISSPTPDRSSLAPISEDTLVPLGELRHPVTVRDLLNATPRPSPGPDSETSVQIDSSDARNERPIREDADGDSNDMVDQQRQPDLLITSHESDDADLDLLADLEGMHLIDGYDVRASEPLPASPFSDPEFQNSLKRGIDLARSILNYLDSCELAAKPGTQLHRLRQTAFSLNSFDYPAKRRIGIVGDSGAGET